MVPNARQRERKNHTLFCSTTAPSSALIWWIPCVDNILRNLDAEDGHQPSFTTLLIYRYWMHRSISDDKLTVSTMSRRKFIFQLSRELLHNEQSRNTDTPAVTTLARRVTCAIHVNYEKNHTVNLCQKCEKPTCGRCIANVCMKCI